MGDDLGLRLPFGRGWSCWIESSTCGTWCRFQVDNVRIELNGRTPCCCYGKIPHTWGLVSELYHIGWVLPFERVYASIGNLHLGNFAISSQLIVHSISRHNPGPELREGESVEKHKCFFSFLICSSRVHKHVWTECSIIAFCGSWEGKKLSYSFT